MGCAVVPLRRTAPDDQGHTARTWRETSSLSGQIRDAGREEDIIRKKKKQQVLVCMCKRDRERRGKERGTVWFKRRKCS